jgi:HlyD family secretion protein
MEKTSMIRHLLAVIVAVTLVTFYSNAWLLAQEEPQNGAVSEKKSDQPSAAKEDKKVPKETGDDKASRKTFEVLPKPIKIEETLEGMFVAETMQGISLQPEEWSTFKIEEVIAPGTKVQEGETIIEFDHQDLLEAIADLELELHLSEQKIMRAEEEIPQQQRSLKRQLADAEEGLRRTEEDYQTYKTTERKQSIDIANMSLKVSKFSLDYYRDELDQLEKMYEADDLTEDTEEIVLRRQRFYVERAEFDYELSKYRHGKTLEVTIPRRDRDMEESLENAKDRLDRAQTASQVDLNIARYELEKQKQARSKASERHVQLLGDKSLMAIKAPIAGVVYYGECVDGKWSKLADVRAKLQPDKTVAKGTTFMTIVDPTSLYFLTNLDEKLLISIKQGEQVKVQPTVEGSEALQGKIASIAAFPISAGKFETKIGFNEEMPSWLVPGMSGKATVVTYEKNDALLVPVKAVHKNEMTDEEYVWVVHDDEVKQTTVETGKKKGGQVEITAGLTAGATISLEDEEKRKE